MIRRRRKYWRTSCRMNGMEIFVILFCVYLWWFEMNVSSVLANTKNSTLPLLNCQMCRKCEVAEKRRKILIVWFYRCNFYLMECSRKIHFYGSGGGVGGSDWNSCTCNTKVLKLFAKLFVNWDSQNELCQQQHQQQPKKNRGRERGRAKK